MSTGPSASRREGAGPLYRASALDFDVEIARAGAGYTVTVRSPAGEATSALAMPWEGAALAETLNRVEAAVLQSGPARRSVQSSDHAFAQQFGTALFGALFSSEVLALYAASVEQARQEGAGLRLRMRLRPPELAALPWELLYEARRREFVCLSTNTPLVRHVAIPLSLPRLRVDPPLRILGMCASPRGLAPLDVQREVERTKTATRALCERGLIEMKWVEGTTWRHLKDEAQTAQFNVFHFVGHGGFDAARDEGFVVLEDESGGGAPLMASDLALLLVDQPSLRLVLLNSCDGARGGSRDLFSAAASILVSRGVPAVIAMQYPVTDQAAVELSRGLYEALVTGAPVDAALSRARQCVRLAMSGTLEWATPVLHMRSFDGALFDVRAPSPAPAPSPATVARDKTPRHDDVAPAPEPPAPRREDTRAHAVEGLAEAPPPWEVRLIRGAAVLLALASVVLLLARIF
ncbi:MAG TPA: CHAT domain-containing protein [Myxococcota bacterium]|jgi:hypothetical protein|nr:CHAT domain-containing protein [Myxococcota bacterium]